MDSEFSCKIQKHYATIGTSKRDTLELNLVSFNDYPARVDLRRWATGPDGERIPLKGVSLNQHEIQALSEALKKILLEGE